MKKYIVLVFELIILIGCKSIPLVSSETKTNTEISEHKDIISKHEIKVDEMKNRVEILTLNEDITIVIIKTEYDTDKPVRPDTGKHPVKSETKAEITNNKQGETIATENTVKSEENTTDSADKSTVHAKSNQLDKAKQESPKDPYRFRYIFYIVAVLAVILIIFNRSRIVSFFKKILKL